MRNNNNKILVTTFIASFEAATRSDGMRMVHPPLPRRQSKLSSLVEWNEVIKTTQILFLGKFESEVTRLSVGTKSSSIQH